MFGDKQATTERFKETYRTKLTDDIRARLVLENDEVRSIVKQLVTLWLRLLEQMCYNADDLLPVCEELNIPLVVSRHLLHLTSLSHKRDLV